MISKVWKIIDIIKWAEEYFKEKNVDSPRLTIELMLCEVLELNRVDLYLKFDKPLVEEELFELRKMVKSRAEGRPLQYILGHTQFMDMKIYVDENVLIPRPETELLCSEIFKIEKDNDPKLILDIGTGSGIIGLEMAKKFPEAKVFAVDKFDAPLELAKKNKKQNKVKNVEFHKLDILDKIPKTKFDIVVSNPPYIAKNELDKLQKEVIEHEPITSLSDKADGLSFYSRFAEIFQKILNRDGRFYLEIDSDNSNKIFELFLQKYNVKLIKDQFGLDRFIFGNLKS